ncbi:unnamed protein product [Nippostrongylus brasiliensis]|uniref:Uncharacterized protein n=1 Tax=Nippostrongylus brasiliensis TaxID=27835 RepID=A0A0N4Y5T2_NIPBR|nr:unnamed protein product [Nippostrongylus brasiliensis]
MMAGESSNTTSPGFCLVPAWILEQGQATKAGDVRRKSSWDHQDGSAGGRLDEPRQRKRRIEDGASVDWWLAVGGR